MPTSTRAARRDQKVAGDSGFTLTETLVSITLLALVGGGATTGIVGGLRAQSNNEYRTVAANLARADVDDARAVQYPAYPLAVPSTPVQVGAKTFSLARSVTAPGSTATTCPDTITSTGVLSLTVTSTVSWDNGTQKIAMSTVISC